MKTFAISDLVEERSLILDFKLMLERSKLTLPQYTKQNKTSPHASKTNSIPNHEKISVDLGKDVVGNKENVKEENISYKDKTESFIQDLSNLQGSQSQSISMT